MLDQMDELNKIVTKFSESGWDVIDNVSKVWLREHTDPQKSKSVTMNLIAAVEKADSECGNCGCEFDPLYKRALTLLQN